jgi:hypothetical protein
MAASRGGSLPTPNVHQFSSWRTCKRDLRCVATNTVNAVRMLDCCLHVSIFRLRKYPRMQFGHRILILGASYGSLLATKLLLAGHSVKLVCLAAAADLINREGTRVSLPIEGRQEFVVVDSRELPGELSAAVPGAVDPGGYDLVVLAMQEAQYRSPDVRALLAASARTGIPCLSIMNMPPLPYLARIPGVAVDQCRTCYADASVWDALDPALVTHSSADPQASHDPARPGNAIRVRLPSNFRAARFESETHTRLLRRLAADIDAARFDTSDGRIELPVKLKVHDSVFLPLSKWPMMIAGNYRCIAPDGIRSIAAAVHTDLDASHSVYEWVLRLCRALGAGQEDLVPFERYAAAAAALTVPSSAARALSAGASQIERVDRLVQSLAAQRDMQLPALDDLVSLVDARLDANQRAQC